MIQGVIAGFQVHGFYKMFLAVKSHIRTYINCKGILLLSFSVLTQHAFSQDYNFRNFSSEEGLLRPYVYSITQDTLGYLWVGTDEGLLRYNGFIFEHYTTNDSMAYNFVTSSIRFGGGLWFGHMNGRLSFYNGKKFNPVIYPGRNLSPITHFAKSPDGEIWMSTLSDGLFKLDKDKIVFESKIFKDQQFIHSFDFLNDNELLVGTGSGLILCNLKKIHEIEIIRRVIEIPESKVTGIKKMRKGYGF